MLETAIEIRTSDGTADGFLYHAEGATRNPGLIHLTDIGGVRASHRGMAQRLAEQGFTVLLPNVFYRTGKPPVIEFPFKPGDERSMKRFAELTEPMTPEAMERDGWAYVAFLAAQNSVGPGPIGVVGYCFIGAMSLRTAAARPDKIGAAASFHGGGLFTDKPTSPHLALPRVKAHLYFGHATQDRTMPQEAIDNFNGTLAAWNGRYESEIYDGALHGWTVPDSHACRFRRSMQHLSGNSIWRYVQANRASAAAVRFYLNRKPFLCFVLADDSWPLESLNLSFPPSVATTH